LPLEACRWGPTSGNPADELNALSAPAPGFVFGPSLSKQRVTPKGHTKDIFTPEKK